VIRTAAAEIKMSGRQTMGVRLVNLAPGQSLVAIARNEESLDGNGAAAAEDEETNGDGAAVADADGAVPDVDGEADSDQE
jgi:DNA gyrase subunit A